MVLDASGNGMGGTEIEPLLDLYRLETLNLADNDIEEMAQVCLVYSINLAKGPEGSLVFGFEFQLHASSFRISSGSSRWD